MGKIIDLSQRFLILIIQIYQYLISPLRGNCCRFYPSCSHYAIQALRAHGVCYGLYLTLGRILRCHPGCEGGHDPIPEKKYGNKHA